MQIEVEAKLILTVPTLEKDDKSDKAGDIVLAVEQHLNEIGGILTSGTHVGIRVHVEDYKVIR